MGLSLRAVVNDGAAVTLERQARSESSFYGSQGRGTGGSLRSVESRYVPPSRTRRVMLTLTVDESEWRRARATIVRSAGSDIDILRVMPVPRTSDLRVHIGLESNALGETMSRIMRSLKAAEFGPVTPVPASRTRPFLTVVPKEPG